ncbi:hypothetical protein ARALYDRAFT_347194 [Arabidopsis lyrata subsp. lyrata]|uniref:Uncharacterized protein n=1 Tax=Arabidopsis lyrata subsp. lyrata TaxID=81972 RepID=D7LPQ9_ARALL|nr:hypothetical protein ARALYDRAFT_347194 [Arabidopsis lyrata subsp. lyrata]
MAFSEDLMSKCSEQINAYKAACEEDPELKSFDASLQQKTIKMIDSLTVDTKTGSVSPHEAHMKIKLIKKEQEDLVEKMSDAIKNIEKEEKSIENVLFGSAFALLAGASIAELGTAGKVGFSWGLLVSPLLAVGWFGVHSYIEKKNALNKQLEDLQKLEDVAKSAEKGLIINEEATETVSKLVEGLENRIKHMFDLVDNAIDHAKNEAEARYVLNKISKKVDNLTRKIEEVGESVENHSKLIVEARRHVMEKINRFG